MSLGCFRCSPERAAVTSLTNPHHFTALTLFIFRPSPVYATIEMLILPFNKYVWIGIIVLEAIKVTFILYTYKFRRQLYDTVYPNTYGVTLINSISILLGIPIKEITRRNLSRFVLLLWILFNFVIRNCYSSRYFDLLTIESQGNIPEGLNDLLHMDYKLLMSEASVAIVKNVSGSLRFKIESIPVPEEYSFVEYMLERKEMYFKYAGVTPVEYVRLYKRKQGKRKEIYILPEIIYNQHLCIYFSKHSFLVRRVDFILLNLRSAGLISYWAKRRRTNDGKDSKTRNDVEDPLDLEDFAGTIYLTFSGFTISCLAFIGELLKGHYSQKKKPLRPRKNISSKYAGRWYHIFAENNEMSGEQIITRILRAGNDVKR